MTKLKQWYFSVEEEDTFPKKTMIGKSFEEYPSTQAEFQEIDEVIFSIDIDDIDEVEELPDFLIMLPNLKRIGIPIDWLDKIKIPENIIELRLFSQVYSYDNEESWPKYLKLLNLKHLSIPELTKPYNIPLKDFVSLESIEYDFAAEKDNTKIIDIASLPNIKKVIINQAKNMSIFSPFINKNIINMELFACTGKKLSIENLSKLKSLEKIRINNISVELDCNLLLKLEKLEVLEILNIKNVTNIKTLLNHKKLKSLYVINCKNSFSNVDKELFYNHSFQFLDIEYS